MSASPQPERPQCGAYIHDSKLPHNTSKVRQCRRRAQPGSRWCASHERHVR